MPARGYDTGGPNTGYVSPYDERLSGATGSITGSSLAKALKQDTTSLAKALSTTASKEASTAFSSGGDTPYACPAGYELARESTGSGYWVCRSKTSGREIPVQLKTSGGGGTTGGGTTGGGTTGGGTTGGGTTNSGSEYLTAAADTFARNPQALLADILERAHPDDNSGLGIYHMLAPYGDAANVIFLGQAGQDAGGGTKDQFVDWLENDYWNALMTPGATIDVESVINNALAPAANSPLAAYLAVGTPEQQARNFQNLYAGAMQVGYHPLIADAMNYRMNYAANEFLGETGRGEADPFYQWIQSSMPSISRAY